MNKEYIEELITDLYNDKRIQEAIDLLDELLMAGSIYIDEEV